MAIFSISHSAPTASSDHESLNLQFLLENQRHPLRTRGAKHRLILLDRPVRRGGRMLLQSHHGGKIGGRRRHE